MIKLAEDRRLHLIVSGRPSVSKHMSHLFEQVKYMHEKRKDTDTFLLR
jgi:hypothetical protein